MISAKSTLMSNRSAANQTAANRSSFLDISQLSKVSLIQFFIILSLISTLMACQPNSSAPDAEGEKTEQGQQEQEGDSGKDDNDNENENDDDEKKGKGKDKDD